MQPYQLVFENKIMTFDSIYSEVVVASGSRHYCVEDNLLLILLTRQALCDARYGSQRWNVARFNFNLPRTLV